VGEISQANTGLIARDLTMHAAASQHALQEVPTPRLLAICKEAGRLFAEAELDLDGAGQSPADYVRLLSATTGLPHALCRANMGKVRYVLENMATVLGGLTRGLDLEVLDRGWTGDGADPVSYQRQADNLGAVLPSNSPGVHSLWIPAIALKVPVVLRPGRLEPWTPFRIAQALMAAGCPPQAVSFYPSDYAGAAEILLRCHRSMIFGDAGTVAPWKDDRRVQLHGPGWSKVIVGPDQTADWRQHVDVMATSVADNGGRSCVNASGVWLAGGAEGLGREVAVALAQRLAEIVPRDPEDPEAVLAAFPDAAMAQRLAAFIDAGLATPGAEDLTAALRGGSRVVERDGLAYVLPTVIWCRDPGHPLASAEFLFPFVTVVQVPAADILRRIGPTLVGTVLTSDQAFAREAMNCRHIERLNLGSLPTCRVSWSQPHEGNLFQHLYRHRAFLAASDAA
jgi:acyl-CoA reductase-like NAD-dependent aldehyde dehydrogenase